MPTVTGTVRGEEGEQPDTSFNVLNQDVDAGVIETSPATGTLAGTIRNTGTVAQEYTITPMDLSANVNSVEFHVGAPNSTNVRTVQPGQFYQVYYTVDVNIPETSDPGQPANEEPFSFGFDQALTVV